MKKKVYLSLSGTVNKAPYESGQVDEDKLLTRREPLPNQRVERIERTGITLSRNPKLSPPGLPRPTRQPDKVVRPTLAQEPPQATYDPVGAINYLPKSLQRRQEHPNERVELDFRPVLEEERRSRPELEQYAGHQLSERKDATPDRDYFLREQGPRARGEAGAELPETVLTLQGLMAQARRRDFTLFSSKAGIERIEGLEGEGVRAPLPSFRGVPLHVKPRQELFTPETSEEQRLPPSLRDERLFHREREGELAVEAPLAQDRNVYSTPLEPSLPPSSRGRAYSSSPFSEIPSSPRAPISYQRINKLLPEQGRAGSEEQRDHTLTPTLPPLERRAQGVNNPSWREASPLFTEQGVNRPLLSRPVKSPRTTELSKLKLREPNFSEGDHVREEAPRGRITRLSTSLNTRQLSKDLGALVETALTDHSEALPPLQGLLPNPNVANRTLSLEGLQTSEGLEVEDRLRSSSKRLPSQAPKNLPQLLAFTEEGNNERGRELSRLSPLRVREERSLPELQELSAQEKELPHGRVQSLLNLQRESNYNWEASHTPPSESPATVLPPLREPLNPQRGEAGYNLEGDLPRPATPALRRKALETPAQSSGEEHVPEQRNPKLVLGRPRSLVRE